VALTNVAETTVRARGAEAALAGGSTVAEAAERVVDDVRPGADAVASAEYRTHLARVLTRRALEQLR